MKLFKRLMAVMFALTLTLGMGTRVYAEEEPKHTITITARGTQSEGHVYEAYKIFAGTYDETSEQLKNLSWGANVNDSTLLAALAGDETIGEHFTTDMTAAQAAAAMSELTANELKALADVIGENITGEPAGTSEGEKSPYTIDVTGDGYYFIKDQDDSLEGPDTYSSFILQVVGDEAVTTKDSTTTSEKKVIDANDTAGTATNLQDSADYDIGDDVPFQLKATVADDYAKYEAYTLIFHDVESNGLSFNEESVVVKIDGTEIKAGFEIITENEDGCTFEVVFENLKNTSAHAGSVITVDYTSVLNENAVVGQKGNPNTMHVEFSNNPNGDQQGTGTTKDDTVIVFTYKSTVTKVDENEEELTGADFTLYKEVATVEEGEQPGTLGSEIKEGLDDKVKADALKDDSRYVVVGTDCGVKTGDTTGNTFTFNGIDDGTYVLVETTVPTGYNAWEATEFVVEATHTQTADINPSTGMTADGTSYVLTELTGEDLFGDEGDGTVTLEAEKADLDVTISNQSGSTLPSTGGIGTTIFYVLGGLLVAGAGIVLVARKKAAE